MTQCMNANLQSLCLKTIASNFDRFCAAFHSNGNECYGLYVEFIQKLYSSQILEKLCDANLLKNEHLQFVINKHTKEVDVRNLLSCDICAIEERLRSVGNTVIKFSMVGVKKFYNCDSFFRHLVNIQILELKDTNCTDKSLMIISENCTQLKSLDLCFCERVTDKGLMFLCQRKPPLESLNVEKTSVTFKSVACVLRTIPSINKLWFDNVPRAIFEAAGLNDNLGDIDDVIFNLRNIVILNNPMRPENHLTVILKVCKSICPFIKDLIVTEIITEEQLNLCSMFENLEVVNLQCSMVVSPRLCINNFLQLRGDRIRFLTLTSFSLSVEVLASNCCNLECLTLEYPSFQEMKIRSINFPCLRIFNLQNASLELAENQTSAACIIASSPNLQEIHIVNCQFSEEMTEVVLNYPKKLTTLNFSSTVVDAKFIEDILRTHKDLTKLVIDNSGISSDEYDDLMDIVDDLESKVSIVWADYSEAIRELYNADFDSVFRGIQRHILKL